MTHSTAENLRGFQRQACAEIRVLRLLLMALEDDWHWVNKRVRRLRMATFRDVELRCCGCGKGISYEQAIFWHGKHYCLDSILDLLAKDDASSRVSVSVDLLTRLRDGVL